MTERTCEACEWDYPCRDHDPDATTETPVDERGAVYRPLWHSWTTSADIDRLSIASVKCECGHDNPLTAANVHPNVVICGGCKRFAFMVDQRYVDQVRHFTGGLDVSIGDASEPWLPLPALKALASRPNDKATA